MDLRKYKAPIHKAEFEEIGTFYFCKVSYGRSNEIDAIEDPDKRIKTFLSECLCDENGKLYNYTHEELESYPTGIIKTLYLEFIEFHERKKKIISQKKK